MCDQAVEVFVVGSLDSQISPADVIDGFIINHEAAVGVLKGCVCSEDRVVWLDNRGSNLRGRVYAELELALLAIIDRQALHQQGTEARSSTATERVEDEESLEPSAIIRNPSNLVQDLVNQFLTNSVVATCIVVRSILFASNHLLRMEQVSICAGTNFVDHVWLKIAVDGSRDIFALT